MRVVNHITYWRGLYFHPLKSRSSHSLQSRRIWGYDKRYEYFMPPSWMIKLKEGWGESKKDSEGEDDRLKKEEGEGERSGKTTPLTRPSFISPNSLRIQNSGLLTRVRIHPKTPALQANLHKTILESKIHRNLSNIDRGYGFMFQLAL